MDREGRMKQGRVQATLQEGRIIQEEQKSLKNLNSTFIQTSIVH